MMTIPLIKEIPPYQITRFIHSGMLIFALSAWLTSNWADTYEDSQHLGFTIHSWIGMGMVCFICLRLFYGLTGPTNVRLSQLIPTTKDRFRLIWEDLLGLFSFKLPTGPTHQGLSGIIKLFGLLVFTWMALTGSTLFILVEPGTEAKGFLELIMELHGIGETLIPLYLALHIGITVFYAIKGRDLWRKMFFLK